jgi:hypothetical protein
VDTDCQTRTCTLGLCGFDFVAAGTPTASQVAGDCKQLECDGTGGETTVNDDGDLPDDQELCTSDVCTNGVPSNPPESAGFSCGVSLVCDGAGNCVGCNTPNDCPGVDDECQTRTCVNNTCGFDFEPAGTALATQTPGDCLLDVCDGAGHEGSQPEDTDVFVDGNQCTDDLCQNGVPSNPDTAAGAVCSQNGGNVCDGSGSCVECVTPLACPGTDDECQQRTCILGACGMSFTAVNTPVSTQTTGDCVTDVCDGAGAVVPLVEDIDLPVDGNQCTDDVCTLGTPSNPPLPSGTTCNQGGGTTCDGAGSCVECVTPATCPGTDTECATRTCVANACGMAFQPAGTVVATQTPGDCVEDQCDGAGSVAPAVDDTDLPVDGVECTDDVCTLGTPSNPASPSGALCSIGGVVCDGAGVCVECVDGSQCATNICKADHTCLPATCVNGLVDPGETDVDCGGPACPACAPGDLCSVSTDCQAGICTVGGTCEGDLFFSEYVEGTMSNKAIEIVNLTGAAFDLTQCVVRLYTNGATSPGSTLTLAGSLANQDVLVICQNSSGTIGPFCDQTSGVANFNGNDALELFCNGTTLDVMGQIGFDPGAPGWGSGNESMVNHTLRRKCSVLHGDTNGLDAFDPATEWTGFAIDTFSGLGSPACAP